MSLIGRTITKIRPMTTGELSAEGWDIGDNCSAIEFDDGTVLYPSRDEEGNGPGAFFGVDKNGNGFIIAPLQQEKTHG
jgi:hypothetical protein